MTDKALRFTLKCEKAWLDLVAQKQERDATAWGIVLDCMIDGDGAAAVRKARTYSFDQKTILAIEDAFDLTSGA